LKPDHMILFNNIKNLKEEKKEKAPKKQAKSKLVETLAPHFEYFINDAFSIASKSYASSVGFSYLLPSFIGRNFQKEIETLQDFKDHKKVTFVLGGDKSEHLIKLMQKHNKKTNTFLTTGLFSQLCLKEKGVDLGNSNKFIKEHKELVVSGGILEEKLIGPKMVSELAAIPSREILLAKLVYIINAPRRGLVVTLSGAMRNFVSVLSQIRK